MSEQWKSIPGINWYQASDQGRIRRTVPGSNSYPGKVLKPGTDKRGYRYVTLGDGFGKQASHRVHRLVAAAFMGKCPPLLEVDHINTNKADNRTDNLEYVTHAENMRRARDRGLLRAHRGEDVNTAILTEEDVSELLTFFVTTEDTADDLADYYAITSSAVYRILNGKNWKHIARPNGLNEALKRKGHYGKRPSHDLAKQVRETKATGATYAEIQRRFRIGRATAHRMVKRQGRYAH